MKPIIALVGRPNVGKSTLFNRLTKSRQALVADRPGLTRDRIYGTGKVDDHEFIVIDTAGLGEEEEDIHGLMSELSLQALDEADVILFLVDGRGGLTAADEQIAHRVRQSAKPALLLVNKTEGLQQDIATAEFYSIGMSQVHAISSAHGSGVTSMMQQALQHVVLAEDEDEEDTGIKLAIVGRPNVGKSTLVNRMLGEDRVLVYDEPGTTRDSIYIPFERDGERYTLIDTAGVRRRHKVSDMVEKFSVAKTLQAIESAHVVMLVIDARVSVTDQDLTLAGFILESGKSLVITLNKWDGLSQELRDKAKDDVGRKLHFLEFAKKHYISALHGSGVGNLFESVNRAYQSAIKQFSTAELNRFLEHTQTQHPPPMVKGRRIKLRYAHQGGKVPPLIIIHGSQAKNVPSDYQRYLANAFRKILRLEGTPVKIEFRSGGENPYATKRGTLAERQLAKKRRLKKTSKYKP
ncbi:GTP-binding protein EngA [hydrothermal vent metagenome]|uniref:GTPase Der n=1 Tax=hydrothermal vent metagenome TaxID=652676 RepID=A0A3B0ZJC3_9ZZZZ